MSTGYERRRLLAIIVQYIGDEQLQVNKNAKDTRNYLYKRALTNDNFINEMECLG